MKENSKIAFAITRIKNTSNNPCCTKKLIEKDGKLISQPFWGICDGEAEVVRFPGLKAFGGFISSNLRNPTCDTLFVSGMPKNHQFHTEKFKIKNLNRATKNEASLCKKDFAYSQAPTVALLDYDPPKSDANAHHHDKIVKIGLINVLHSIVPELQLNMVERIEKPSTSAGIHLTDARGKSQPYNPRDGRHIYFLASDGTKIEAVTKYLEQACILNGLYWIEPNTAGKGILKTPVDTAPSRAYTPRIIVPAKITTAHNSKIIIEQDRKACEPEFIPGQLGMLDLSEFMDHTAEKITQCHEIKKKALAGFNNQPDTIASIAKLKKKLKNSHKHSEVSNLQLSRSIDALVDRNTIFGDFLLHFDEIDDPVTAQILASAKGEQYDGMKLHDPLDPSPKNRNKSIFFSNNGKNPLIHSLKHGGYCLRVRAEETLSSNDWLNRRHAQILLSGKILYVVDKTDAGDISQFEERLSFVSGSDLKAMYAGEHAHDELGAAITDSKGKPINKVVYWLKWSGRNKFNGVTFEPIPRLFEDDYDPLDFQSSVLNTYRGLAFRPAKGDVTILKDYILNVICNGDEELSNYVSKWIARMLQRPDLQAQTALVVKSPEGTGKTLFWCSTIGSFFGQAFFETANGEDVLGNFNGVLSNVVFVNFNEAIFGGDKTAQGKLKQLITDEKFTVRKLYQDVRQCKNHTHLVFTSNNAWVVGVGESDRRYVIFEMSKKMSPSYYKRYAKWLNNGGREFALHYFMNEVDISEFDPTEMPAKANVDSVAKLQQKLLTAGNMVSFMVHILGQGRFGMKTLPNVGNLSLKDAGIDYDRNEGYSIGWVEVNDGSDATLTIPKDVFYEEYKSYCRINKWGSTPNMLTLGRFLKGSISGEGDEVFAVECQKFKDIYPTGKRWRISWQDVVLALNNKLDTRCMGDMVDILDVISTESGFSDSDNDWLDSMG